MQMSMKLSEYLQILRISPIFRWAQVLDLKLLGL